MDTNNSDEKVFTMQRESRQQQDHPKYCVMLLNDDFTPMDFVVEVLQCFFHMSEQQATTIMLKVHNAGQAECGRFTKDVAETIVTLVSSFAKQHEYPLLCKMEKLES